MKTEGEIDVFLGSTIMKATAPDTTLVIGGGQRKRRHNSCNHSHQMTRIQASWSNQNRLTTIKWASWRVLKESASAKGLIDSYCSVFGGKERLCPLPLLLLLLLLVVKLIILKVVVTSVVGINLSTPFCGAYFINSLHRWLVVRVAIN